MSAVRIRTRCLRAPSRSCSTSWPEPKIPGRRSSSKRRRTPKSAAELLGDGKAVKMMEDSYRQIVGLPSAITGYRQFFTAIAQPERVGRLPLVGRRIHVLAELYDGVRDLVSPGRLELGLVLAMVAWGAEGMGFWLVVREYDAQGQRAARALQLHRLDLPRGALHAARRPPRRRGHAHRAPRFPGARYRHRGLGDPDHPRRYPLVRRPSRARRPAVRRPLAAAAAGVAPRRPAEMIPRMARNGGQRRRALLAILAVAAGAPRPLVGGARRAVLRLARHGQPGVRPLGAGDRRPATGSARRVFFQAPLYPYLSARSTRLAGRSLDAVYLLQIAAAVAGFWALYRAGAGDGGRAGRAGGGGLAAFYGPFLFHDVQLLKESLAVTAACFLLWALPRRARSGRAALWLAAGAAPGGARPAARERAAPRPVPPPARLEPRGAASAPVARRARRPARRPGARPRAGGAAQRDRRRRLPAHHLPGGRQLLHRQQPGGGRHLPADRPRASRSRRWSGRSRCGSPSASWAGSSRPAEVSSLLAGQGPGLGGRSTPAASCACSSASSACSGAGTSGRTRSTTTGSAAGSRRRLRLPPSNSARVSLLALAGLWLARAGARPVRPGPALRPRLDALDGGLLPLLPLPPAGGPGAAAARRGAARRVPELGAPATPAPGVGLAGVCLAALAPAAPRRVRAAHGPGPLQPGAARGGARRPEAAAASTTRRRSSSNPRTSSPA